MKRKFLPQNKKINPVGLGNHVPLVGKKTGKKKS
jgi:hypothetical protein